MEENVPSAPLHPRYSSSPRPGLSLVLSNIPAASVQSASSEPFVRFCCYKATRSPEFWNWVG